MLCKNVFSDYEIKNTEVQILAVLLAAGLLGGILNFVLRKFVREFVEDYLSKDDTLKPLIEEELDKRQRQIKEEDDRNKIEETESENKLNSNDSLNTVIVPVQNSINSIINSLKYECPDTYKFKHGLEYISFYKDKEIVGYGKLKFPNEYNNSKNGRKEFQIESFNKLEIPHDRKGAFIQNKMYCNSTRLLSAKTTDDIR